MSFVDKWMKCHVGISFATLECVWESNMEISCMWVTPYIGYCIWHKVSIAIVATCPITFEVI
jgi:hypothetical protein